MLHDSPMREVRVYTEQQLTSGANIELSDGAARHISQVLRMKTGQSVVLFDGRGGEYPAEIVDIDRRSRIQLTLSAHNPVERESPLQITLWHGLCRAERMDTVVQKATELGVSAIQPMLTERSMIRLDEKRSAKKIRHWRQIAISACEQSGRNRVPEVMVPMRFNQLLRMPIAADVAIVLHPSATRSLTDTATGCTRVLLCTGPEGGFSEAEIAAAEAAGMVSASFGPRVLRTETAPLAALSVLQALAGDLS